ncbi:hypothetical protein [Brevibacillus migulae]|uniref:hypothetical protein n=1 Tax=Brevibacillus migulae TaxID=1644114 RepID=UPI00106E8293|nr:hypothetical protein [Brevibacillus migulae]
MRQRSTTFYLVACLIMGIMAVTTLIKVFADHHPLRFLFTLLYVIGLAFGYFRYVLHSKTKEMQQHSKWLKYGLILLFAATYAALKYGIKTWLSYEVSSQDYGTVFAFFILGLFLSYYGLLAKARNTSSP